MVLVMVGTMASYSLSVLLPLFFEGANGSTAFAAGLLLLGPVLVNAASSFAGGKLYDRVGAWPLIPAGLTLVVAGQVALFFLSEHLLVGLVVLSAALIYVGQGLAYTPSKTAALRQLPPDLYPHGASINSTLVQVASSIGSSLFVGVLSADVLRGTAAGLAEDAGLRRRVRPYPGHSHGDRRRRSGGRLPVRPRHAQTLLAQEQKGLSMRFR